MILREYQPTDTQLLAWVADVRRALSAALGGIRHADNIGPQVTLRYLAARAPIDVSVPVNDMPLGVYACALNRTSLRHEDGCRVQWTWRRGSMRIHDIDVSSTSDEYDVTLNVWMG